MVETSWWTSLTSRLESALSEASWPSDKLAFTVLLIAGVWLARRLVLRAVERRVSEPTTVYRWRKATLYTSVPIVVLLLAVVWLREFGSLATFLGLVSAGLAIALRDLVTSLAGWLFILVRKPFDIGDRIQVGSFSGDVIDLRIFKFTLMEIGNWVDADQSTGRVVHVPNSLVLTESLVNYSRGFEFIWNEIGVLVTFESNWREAKRLLQEIADRHAGDAVQRAEAALARAAKRFLIYYSNLTPIVYTAVKDSGVMLTIRHLSEPRRRRGVSQAIWEDILTAFGERDDIDFAYPTWRFYDNRHEGKAGAAAPPAGKVRDGD